MKFSRGIAIPTINPGAHPGDHKPRFYAFRIRRVIYGVDRQTIRYAV